MPKRSMTDSINAVSASSLAHADVDSQTLAGDDCRE
jgi:hypothetical protein